MEIPDFTKAFEYENNFYLSCDLSRMGKLLAQYELFKKIRNLPGEIVECGVFKGASLCRFAMLRELFENSFSRKIIGFDTFGEYPETNYEDDKKLRQKFISDAGSIGLSEEQLSIILKNKNCNKEIEFIKGDISQTVPEYLKEHPELKIALLHLDTDIYEPAVAILENLYSRIVNGGVLIIDDYGVFPGETKAVDDFFKNKNIKIKKFSFCKTPCFVIIENGK